MHNAIFCEQMALTTPITNADLAMHLRSLYRGRGDYLERMGEIRRAFLAYLLDEDRRYISVEASSPQYASQQALLRDISYIAEGKEIWKAPASMTDVIGIVDWFNAEKGYGFVDVEDEGVDGGVFLHAERLEESGFDRVSDGDEILCDIQLGRRGWSVVRVHDIQTDPNSVQTCECEIIRLFPDREYGFVVVGDGTRTAFFHYSFIPEASRARLSIRARLLADIGPDKLGQLQVRRLVRFLD